ncbi:MAG TPA: DNA adenine methylase [Polyangia bacterium]|nr:DNA adenine methylase [Polyangia bacterium]
MSDSVAPRPFLKWAGGKRQLLPRILALVPPRIGTYVEPFLGGGALFFALAAERRFRRAVLGDVNAELINCYSAVRDDVAGVIAKLARMRNTPTTYYKIRAQRPDALDPVARAARVIYLNRCGYNGLYRVNSDGNFNVPFGRYARPRICDPDGLRAASQALAGVELVCGDFNAVLSGRGRRRLGADDFVYLDPPYVPISKTASFTGYAGGFSMADQERLAQQLRRLSDKGIAAVLSNSDCADTRRLYEGLPSASLPARRAINSVASRRGPVAELLVHTAALRAVGEAASCYGAAP